MQEKKSHMKLTIFLVWALITVPMVFLGWFLGNMFGFGNYGFAITLEIMVLLALFIYFSSDGMILRSYKVRRLTKKPGLSKTVDNLARKSGIPTPILFVSENPIPTIFSTGRNQKHASIVLTDSLINLLDFEELEAVLAHEMHHIESGDILGGCISAMISGALTSLITFAMWVMILIGFGKKDDPAPSLIQFFIASIVAPPAAFLIQLLSSQLREYIADEKSAYIYRKPQKLISALNKIQEKVNSNRYEVNPSHVHLFILNPLHESSLRFLGIDLPSYNMLFKTHPPIDDRIDRLNTISNVVWWEAES